jgi:PAS domain S-box-containing protein
VGRVDRAVGHASAAQADRRAVAGQGQKQVLEMIASGEPLADVLTTLIRVIEHDSPGLLGSVLLLENGTHVRHIAAPSLPPEYCRAIDGEPIGPRAGSCGTAAFRVEQVIVEDIRTDPLWTDYRELADRHGLRACWSTPIVDAQHRVLGTFAFYSRRTGLPAARHQRAIAMATHTAAIAIVKAQGERERARLVHDLNERVKELEVLHAAARLFQRERAIDGDLLAEFVRLLPPGWQYPEICVARIIYGSIEAETPGWRETPWRQTAPFGTGDGQSGLIEVAYLEQRPGDAEGPFLAEERRLIDALAELIGAHFERIRIQSALRDSATRLSLATQASNIGLWDWDIARGVVYFSPEWKGQLGYLDHEISSSYGEWESRLHPEDRQRILSEVRTCLAAPSANYELDFRLRHKDGSYRWIYARAQLQRDAGGRPQRLVGCQIDITERRQAEEQRAESQRRNEALVQALGEIVYDWRPLEDRLYWSGDFTRLLGYTADEMGTDTASWTRRVHPDDLPQVLVEAEACARERRPYQLEYRFRRSDGGYAWMLDRGTSFVSASGTLERIVGVFRDITERKRAQEQLQLSFSRLQELSRRLVEVEESERRNINRELHDRVGQNLSALNVILGIMRNGLAGHSQSARLDDARALLEMTSKQVRDVMADLRPAALDDFGLFAALRNHGAAVSARLGIAIRVTGKALDPRLPAVVETALFRIVQEALNNIAKHARASNVKVTLAEAAGQVRLTIADDGVGFEAARAPRDEPTYGIVSMHERAEAVGARLRIVSAPGEGTRVEVEAPRVPE